MKFYAMFMIDTYMGKLELFYFDNKIEISSSPDNK